MAMSPDDINTAARQRYNAVGDDFWSNQEVFYMIYQACCEMATEGLIIEQTYSTVSVANQQQYSFPTNAMNIKRITYDGRKLDCITFREDDVLTVLNQATVATGVPSCYMIWNDIIYLRPIPSTAALTIKIWSNIQPQLVASGTTIEIPDVFEMSIVNFILSEMSAKNKNYAGSAYYRNLWEKDLINIRKFARKRKIGDAFQIVKNVDIIPQSDLGTV